MSFEWTPRRFVSGALALDVANSVILRFDPNKRIDRFADVGEISRFADAAQRLSHEQEEFSCLEAVPETRIDAFLSLRESVDHYFRKRLQDDPAPLALANLLECVAKVLRSGDGDAELCLDTATAYSALHLVNSPHNARMKICANCQWLFLDRSKNKSRTWCDMTVCGNRVKARLHYAKRKQEDRT